MKIYNSTQNKLIANDAKFADNFITRSIGLLLHKEMQADEALIIKPCCSIHTFFMRFNIDVIFVNKSNEIIAIYENVKPFKILPIHFNSAYVIEIDAGLASKNKIKKGDKINITK